MSFFLKKTTAPKVFCIGLNKTGTTTLEQFFIHNDYKIGNQIAAEYLVKDWLNRVFEPIVNHCKKYDAFQDVPFSLPFTYIILEQYFPNAKFILTVRDNPDQWYTSLTLFHSKLWSDGKTLPNAEQLKEATYRYKGYAYKVHKAMFNTKDDDLYNKESLIKYYENHIYNVKEYFKSQPNKLICINVSVKNDYLRLCEFLKKPALSNNFSWKNKTSNEL